MTRISQFFFCIDWIGLDDMDFEIVSLLNTPYLALCVCFSF